MLAVIYIEFALSCFSSLKLYTFYFHVYFAINPGPETLIQNNLKRRNENLPNILDLHINTRVITYTRAELLGIRRASRSFVCGSVLHVLKLNGLLGFRGCRAGRRKISVRISDRVSHTTCRDRTTSRTSVLVPIVRL